MDKRNGIASISLRRIFVAGMLVLLLCSALFISKSTTSHVMANSSITNLPTSANQAFSEASQRFGVPVELLKAICYKEGRLSLNGGVPSIDQRYGCMGLGKSKTDNTLSQAATDLGLNASQLQQNLSANILGGAAVLRSDALALSGNQTLPTSLAGWYGAVAQYSSETLYSTALMYANEVYAILKQGFSAKAATGETILLAAQNVTPQTTTAAQVHAASSLPDGCQNDGQVDYPGAIDCILSPAATYDCNVPTSPSDCNYTSSDRPASCTIETTQIQPCNIDQIVIHDTEGSLTSALNVFQCPGTGSLNCDQASVQYIVDTDGTVYQVLPEQDIAYHVGNFWYNEHTIGIENVGFDATGYQWYNSAEYKASAKLTAYLLKKYHLPLDHTHVSSHGTVPSPSLAASPNHVDPGPYWLWDYFFRLISLQGVLFNPLTPENTITLRPMTDQFPEGPDGTETSNQYNFFSLYTGPSTNSALIPQAGNNDPTDVTYNVEAEISYYYLQKVQDGAGTDDTMYEIWYGEEDQLQSTNPSFFADAQLAWLAVPPGDGAQGTPLIRTKPTAVEMNVGSTAQIYGRPTSNSGDVIGGAPASAIFTTACTVIEDGTTNLWYEINFNHRQAWVPASEVTPQP